ncbi:hypothetical protein Tsp_10598, partial [Trichinella spiralis]|uniref:hypothetical protein n=1 Tax=Trichinella spiralis TaxID=6334 RepID=UPI0001EFD9B6
MSSNNTKSGSLECTVILSVMYHTYLSNRSSDIRDLLITELTGPGNIDEIPCQLACLAIWTRTVEHHIILYLLITIIRESVETTRCIDEVYDKQHTTTLEYIVP